LNAIDSQNHLEVGMHDNDLLGGAVLLANLTYHGLFAGQGLLLQTM